MLSLNLFYWLFYSYLSENRDSGRGDNQHPYILSSRQKAMFCCHWAVRLVCTHRRVTTRTTSYQNTQTICIWSNIKNKYGLHHQNICHRRHTWCNRGGYNIYIQSFILFMQMCLPSTQTVQLWSSKRVFMWCHIKPILQVIILVTTMLVSFFYLWYLKTTKCPRPFHLIDIILPNYNCVKRILAPHLDEI